MADVLAFQDFRERELIKERERRFQEALAREGVEKTVLLPALKHVKKRNFTRWQAKALHEILTRGFDDLSVLAPEEEKIGFLCRFEYKNRDEIKPTLSKDFPDGDVLLSELIVSVQSGIFERWMALRLWWVTKLWYKEVFL